MKHILFILSVVTVVAGCASFPVERLDGTPRPPFASAYYGSDTRWHYFEEDLPRSSLFPMPRSYYHHRFRLSRDEVSVIPEMGRIKRRAQAIAPDAFRVDVKGQ